MDFISTLNLELNMKFEEIQQADSDTHTERWRVRRWGDPVMVAQAGASVDIAGTSNFQAVGLWNKVTGWGGVTNFLNIPRLDIDRLKALQLEDEYRDKQPDWRSQKMNWLCKERGTIYFGGSWKTADSVKWGTIAIGNNFVTVDGYEDIFLKLRGEEKFTTHKMARLRGFRRSDWGRPLKDLLAEGLVHRCYCAYSGNDIGDTPKGIIYSPFWSPLGWRFISDSKPQLQAFYIPAAWLVAV
jgi:hypothetical protein